MRPRLATFPGRLPQVQCTGPDRQGQAREPLPKFPGEFGRHAFLCQGLEKQLCIQMFSWKQENVALILRPQPTHLWSEDFPGPCGSTSQLIMELMC